MNKFCAYCEYRVAQAAHIFCYPCYLELGGYDFRTAIARQYKITRDEVPTERDIL
jgi:hypothetical protein